MATVSVVSGGACSWVIFKSPEDAPGHYVARIFEGDRPTGTALKDSSLKELRALLTRLYPDLVCIRRHPSDEPQIIEIWT